MTANLIIALFLLLCWPQYSCKTVSKDGKIFDYQGTASVTQGYATTTLENFYPAGQRIAGLGTITSTDDKEWVVPAEVNFTDPSSPFAPDLYNPDGKK